MKIFERRRVRQGKSPGGIAVKIVSGAVAASLLALPLAGSAAAIESPSGDPVEARGSIVGAFLGGMALAEAGLTSASSIKNAGPDKQPLNLNVFGGKAIQLPNINLPILKNGPGQPGLLDIGGAVGALNSYAAAQATAGKAAAGAITDSGSIDPSAAQDPSKNINAKIDLRVLLDQLGIDTAHQLVSTAEVDANGLSSSINATKKPVTAADTSYAFADAHARLQVPPVAAITGNIVTGLSALKDPINAVVGDGGPLNTAIAGALKSLNLDLAIAKLKTTGSTVSITGVDDVISALAASLPTTIVSKNGGVTLNLNTGLADVDVAKIYNATGGAKDLNGLPPNTDILDDKMVEALVNGVADVADAVIEKLNTGLKDALLNNLKATIKLAATVTVGVPPLGSSADTTITITGTLAQLAGVTGAGDPVIEMAPLTVGGVPIPLNTVVGVLKPAVLLALKTVIGTPIDALVTSLSARPGPIQAIVEPIVKAAGDLVKPIFEAFKQVGRIIINDQPTLDGRPADIASPTAYTVRALTVVLFPGGLPGFPTPPAPGAGQVPDPKDGLARVSISASTANFGAAAVAPTLKVDPASVPAGGKTSVTGTGWDPATPVSVQLTDPTGAPVGAPVPVTPATDGTLPATDLPVPAGSAPGAYSVVGTQGTNTQTAPLTVTAAAVPTIKADPASVPAGGKTSVTGTGWNSALPVSVQLTDGSGAPVGAPVPVTPAADGTLPATDLPVPATATPGDYTVVGTQGTNKQSAPLTVTAAAVPTIKADPASVPAGTPTKVTGTGWTAAVPVAIQLTDPSGLPVGTPVSVTPGADGTLPATDLPVPATATPGAYTVVGTQGTNTKTAPLTVTAAAVPTIKADPASVPAGGKTSVTGTGWNSALPVSVQLTDPTGAPVGAPVPVTPGADGTLPATDLPVPATATPGDYTVVGTQGTNKQSAPLTVTAAAVPALTVDPASVPAGTPTKVTGTGWTTAVPVAIQLTDPSGLPVGTPVSVTPGADGTLPATDLPVPATATPGAYTVVGTQGTNPPVSTPLTVTQVGTPTIKADPASIPAGGKTSVTGTGWTTAVPVAIQLTDPSGLPVGTPVSVTPGADGTLPATDLPVPATATPGAYTVVGTQGINTKTAPLTVTAAATPALKVDPTSVPAGTPTSVTGTGWDPASPVSVQLTDKDGKPVGTPISINPGTDGTLPATDLPVPAGTTAGDYTVVGTQGTNPPVSTPLTVTAAATPTIKADPASVPAGGKTSVTGTGWDPASPVSVQLTDKDGKPVGTPISITPAADKTLPATDLPVPAGTTAGDYTVVGTQGTNKQSAPLTVTAEGNATASANANVNASASAAASANADSNANAAAQAAAQAAANADQSSNADAAATANANAAAKSAATANAAANASADATSAANASAQAAATAAANSTAQSDANAKASAAADANAAAASKAAANADSSSNASAAAAANANANSTASASASTNASTNASANANPNANSNANGSKITVTIDKNRVVKGTSVMLTVTGTGFSAGEKVAGVLKSEDTPLGSQTADNNGQVKFVFNSQDLALGDHSVTLTSAVDATKTGTVGFTVVTAGSSASSSSISSSSANSSGSSDGLANTGTNNPMPIFVGGGLVLLLGAVLVSLAVGRKRKTTDSGL